MVNQDIEVQLLEEFLDRKVTGKEFENLMKFDDHEISIEDVKPEYCPDTIE